METTPQTFHLHDDSKSFPQVDPLRENPNLQHIEDMASHMQQPQINPTIQHKYYQQFKKIYQTSYKLWLQLKKQRKLKESISSKINSMETQLTALHKTRRIQQEVEIQQENQLQRKINKRTRRTAQQIQRKYNCKADFCGRCYGSQGSLQQHIKLKHPEMYKRQVGQSIDE